MYSILLALFVITIMLVVACCISLSAERRRYLNYRDKAALSQFLADPNGIDWTRHTFIWALLFAGLTVMWTIITLIVVIIEAIFTVVT